MPIPTTKPDPAAEAAFKSFMDCRMLPHAMPNLIAEVAFMAGWDAAQAYARQAMKDPANPKE